MQIFEKFKQIKIKKKTGLQIKIFLLSSILSLGVEIPLALWEGLWIFWCVKLWWNPVTFYHTVWDSWSTSTTHFLFQIKTQSILHYEYNQAFDEHQNTLEFIFLPWTRWFFNWPAGSRNQTAPIQVDNNGLLPPGCQDYRKIILDSWCCGPIPMN